MEGRISILSRYYKRTRASLDPSEQKAYRSIDTSIINKVLIKSSCLKNIYNCSHLFYLFFFWCLDMLSDKTNTTEEHLVAGNSTKKYIFFGAF